VVDGYQKVRPQEPVGLVERAAVLVRQGKPADAAGRLAAGLAGLADDDHRTAAAAEFARTAARAGHAAAGYDAAAKAGQAEAVFRPLAGAALAAGGKAADGLAAVLDAHAGKFPADPWPHYYRAELHRLAGDHAAAVAQLAAGMTKLPPPPTRTTRIDPPPGGLAPGEAAADSDWRERDWATFRSARVAGLYRLGKWRQAYDELPPKVDTFDQLAGLLAADQNADALLALVTAHKAAVPDDAEVLAWQAEVHFTKKDYAAVLPLAVEYGRRNPEAAVPPRLADRWVRSLVRLGRPMEAVAVAESVEPDAAGMTLRAIVTAANGSVAVTTGHLRTLRRLGTTPAELYADPDLGRLIRQPGFAGLHKEFPPPKK
jgi:hypothetical protein